jgi:hypothetical protein
MTTILLVLIAATLLITLWLSIQVNRLRAKLAAVPEDGNVYALLAEVDGELDRIEALLADFGPRLVTVERQLPQAISRTGVVAYDAFGDISGNLSRSIAMLDAMGNGVVISLLVGRGETLFYVKQIKGGKGAEALSPEEEEAVAVSAAG